MGAVALTRRAKRSPNATENPTEAFAGPRQLDGMRKTPQCTSEGCIPTHLVEFVESLWGLRLRPMIDNPDPLVLDEPWMTEPSGSEAGRQVTSPLEGHVAEAPNSDPT